MRVRPDVEKARIGAAECEGRELGRQLSEAGWVMVWGRTRGGRKPSEARETGGSSRYNSNGKKAVRVCLEETTRWGCAC